MPRRVNISLLLIALLAFPPNAVLSQVPIDPIETSVKIFEILDWQGPRLGTVVVVGRTNRGYLAGNEYWRFDEGALREIAAQQSLELAILAAGEWDDPWIVQALEWKPENRSVQWSHPAEVEWTTQDESRPPVVSDGIYFGNATVGGLTIQYSERGPASLTWFKTTDGAFMQLEDGALFTRDIQAPSTGSWWHGLIDRQ